MYKGSKNKLVRMLQVFGAYSIMAIVTILNSHCAHATLEVESDTDSIYAIGTMVNFTTSKDITLSMQEGLILCIKAGVHQASIKGYNKLYKHYFVCTEVAPLVFISNVIAQADELSPIEP